jgi:hypothetical protein
MTIRDVQNVRVTGSLAIPGIPALSVPFRRLEVPQVAAVRHKTGAR